MKRETVGFLGGIIAGFIKLIVEQLLFSLNLLKSTMLSTISEVAFGESRTYLFFSWIIYILLAGLFGLILSKIISNEKEKFFYKGSISGIVIWTLMNVVFMIFGITPTWSMGLTTCIVTFLTHILLGVIILYSISKFHTEVN